MDPTQPQTPNSGLRPGRPLSSGQEGVADRDAVVVLAVVQVLGHERRAPAGPCRLHDQCLPEREVVLAMAIDACKDESGIDGDDLA